MNAPGRGNGFFGVSQFPDFFLTSVSSCISSPPGIDFILTQNDHILLCFSPAEKPLPQGEGVDGWFTSHNIDSDRLFLLLLLLLVLF